MADMTLTARPPLGGFAHDFGEANLAEITDHALVSLATPNGGEKALDATLKKAFKCALPAPGQSTASGKMRVLGLQRDQVFLFFAHDGDRAMEAVAGKLGEAGYYTDQSDSWVMLRLAGPMSRSALERICPLDLHPDVFTVGTVSRTVMEHLGTIILRDGEDSFVLMSARSSAKSFLHAVETSIRNVM